MELTEKQEQLIQVIRDNPDGSNYDWQGKALMSGPTLRNYLKSLYLALNIKGNGKKRRANLIERLKEG